jgi:hypothetical protein
VYFEAEVSVGQYCSLRGRGLKTGHAWNHNCSAVSVVTETCSQTSPKIHNELVTPELCLLQHFLSVSAYQNSVVTCKRHRLRHAALLTTHETSRFSISAVLPSSTSSLLLFPPECLLVPTVLAQRTSHPQETLVASTCSWQLPLQGSLGDPSTASTPIGSFLDHPTQTFSAESLPQRHRHQTRFHAEPSAGLQNLP